MALTRKALKAMGLTDEQSESIIEMHVDTVSSLKDQLDAKKTDKAEYDKLKADFEKIKSDYETAKTTIAANAKLQEQYDAVKAEYDQFKTETENKAAKAAADKTFTKWLTDNGYTEKGAAKIVKYGGFTPEFNKDGTIKNADKLSESISAEWSEYKSEPIVEGAKTENPPTNTGGKPAMTWDEIDKIADAEARQAAIAQNMKALGIKK